MEKDTNPLYGVFNRLVELGKNSKFKSKSISKRLSPVNKKRTKRDDTPIIQESTLSIVPDDLTSIMSAFDDQISRDFGSAFNPPPIPIAVPSLPDMPYQHDRITALEEQVRRLENTVYTMSSVILSLADKTCTQDPAHYVSRSDSLLATASNLISQSRK
jgi:hypothetical protein